MKCSFAGMTGRDGQGHYCDSLVPCGHFTPKEPVCSCKDCIYCELYDGPEKPYVGTKAVMRCRSAERRAMLTIQNGEYCGIYDNFNAAYSCKNFTPKEPAKEPAKEPVEETKPECIKCKHSYTYTGKNCSYNKDGACLGKTSPFKYIYFEPVGEKAETDKPKPKPKPKKKETKMKIGIFKFSTRRYVMACTLIVTAKIAILLNPALAFWSNVLSYREDMSETDRIVANWLLTIVSIVAIVAALWLFNKATKWLFGEKI